jgi:hypothetical protein
MDHCIFEDHRIEALLSVLEEFKRCNNPIPMDAAFYVAGIPRKPARAWLMFHGVHYNRRDKWHLSSHVMKHFPDKHHDRLKQIFPVM